MAGTLVIDTLKSSTTNPPAVQNTNGTEVGQFCRAWVNFNGSTAGIRAAFNVSSVVRNGSGDYTVNFTNALADANYAVIGMNDDRNGADGWPQLKYANGTYPPSTTSCRVVTGKYPGSNANDVTYAMFAIFR